MLLFRDYHIYPMYLGIKVYTRRLWKKPRAVIGATHVVKHKMFDEPELSPGVIIVEQVYRQPLGMMTEEDAYQEGGYTLPLFWLAWEDTTKIPWSPSLLPYVVKFRFTPSDCLMEDESYLRNDLFLKWRTHLNELAKRCGVELERER